MLDSNNQSMNSLPERNHSVEKADTKTENCTVTRIDRITEDLCIIEITLDPQIPDLHFKPGQYAELALPSSVHGDNGKLVRRQYSIASSANHNRSFEFFIVQVQSGVLSPSICKLEVGSRIWMNEKIKGHFTLDEIPQDKNLLFLATGTGLAPFVSMVRTFKDQSRWKNVSIVHGVRLIQDLGYRQELEKLSESDASVRYFPIVSRENWNGLMGRIPSLLESNQNFGFDLNPSDTHILLCGNPEMIDHTVIMLEQKGFTKHSKKTPGQIHFERYW